jgi:hypothetical protein
MDNSSHSDGDVELDLEVIIAPDVPTACKRGPAYLIYRGKYYDLWPYEAQHI